MKFSELEQKLTEKVNVLSARTVVDDQIYSVISAEMSNDSGSGIIVCVNDLCNVNNVGIQGNYLWCGEAPAGLQESNCNWIEIRPEDYTEAVKIISDLLLYDAKLQNMRIRMMEVLVNGKGLDTVVDEMGRELHTTIVILDMSGKIIHYSHPFMIEEPLWVESIKRGFCPPFFIEHLRDVRMRYAEESENEVVLRHCLDNHIYYLANRIFVHGNLYGYAFMLQTDDNFSPYCEYVLSRIGQMTADLVFKNKDFESVTNTFYENLLIDIFQGISSAQIKARINAGEMKFPPRMCIVAIRTRYFQGDNYVRENLARYLQQMFPNERFVYYRKMMIVLFGLPAQAPGLSAEQMKLLGNLCGQEHLIAGISNPYTKVTSTRHYYEQAIKAIELAAQLDMEGNLYEYRHIAFYDLIDNDARLHKVGLYCHPALSILAEYDAANGSQLHETLKSLVSNGFNSSAAATEMFLHRNTLAYRKQKIVSLTGIDLDDFETQFMLKYSYMIENYIQKHMEAR